MMDLPELTGKAWQKMNTNYRSKCTRLQPTMTKVMQETADYDVQNISMKSSRGGGHCVQVVNK